MFLRGRPITMYVPSGLGPYGGLRAELPPERLQLDWVYPAPRGGGPTPHGVSHPHAPPNLGVPIPIPVTIRVCLSLSGGPHSSLGSPSGGPHPHPPLGVSIHLWGSHP